MVRRIFPRQRPDPRRGSLSVRADRPPMPTIFLLSPAHCGGKRGRLLLGGRASFPLAEQLRSPAGAPLGEVFAFVSGLYFRGKLAYARAFAQPPASHRSTLGGGILVITSGEGLCPADMPLTPPLLESLSAVDVRSDNPAYRLPLERSARSIQHLAGSACNVVLLGSIASGKYVDILAEIFGARLLFPADFVGRGDMSRGGLMLRSVAERRELSYVPLQGAVRHGPRPPRLTPQRHRAS